MGTQRRGPLFLCASLSQQLHSEPGGHRGEGGSELDGDHQEARADRGRGVCRPSQATRNVVGNLWHEGPDTGSLLGVLRPRDPEIPSLVRPVLRGRSAASSGPDSGALTTLGVRPQPGCAPVSVPSVLP